MSHAYPWLHGLAFQEESWNWRWSGGHLSREHLVSELWRGTFVQYVAIDRLANRPFALLQASQHNAGARNCYVLPVFDSSVADRTLRSDALNLFFDNLFQTHRLAWVYFETIEPFSDDLVQYIDQFTEVGRLTNHAKLNGAPADLVVHACSQENWSLRPR